MVEHVGAVSSRQALGAGEHHAVRGGLIAGVPLDGARGSADGTLQLDDLVAVLDLRAAPRRLRVPAWLAPLSSPAARAPLPACAGSGGRTALRAAHPGSVDHAFDGAGHGRQARLLDRGEKAEDLDASHSAQVGSLEVLQGAEDDDTVCRVGCSLHQVAKERRRHERLKDDVYAPGVYYLLDGHGGSLTPPAGAVEQAARDKPAGLADLGRRLGGHTRDRQAGLDRAIQAINGRKRRSMEARVGNDDDGSGSRPRMH